MWKPAPQCPFLAEDSVHVWLADLEHFDDRLTGVLCDDELARAARLARDTDRLRWLCARYALRTLLGCYLELDPRSLRFHRGKYGKPSLLSKDQIDFGAPGSAHKVRIEPGETEQRVPLHFNVSHSGAMAVYAVSATIEVGVDIELAPKSLDAVALAGRIFGETEGARLETLAPPLARREFLRKWVALEAELKCLGVGLKALRRAHAGVPWSEELNVGYPDVAASIAAERRPSEMRYWLWSQAWAVAADGACRRDNAESAD